MQISVLTWDLKYRLKEPDGLVIDETIEDTWRRVARALAEAEKPTVREYWENEFYANMAGFHHLPAGRILSGAGTRRAVTLFNCYVMGTIHDSMPGIFDAVKEAALTQQQGGGIGNDFSSIRPKGFPVVQVGADASGPLSFMDVWNTMCKTIMSAGSRRGAMMATLRCDHPDIEDFVEAKRDPERFRNFNLSVLVTDAFMAAVECDDPWDLVFDGKVHRTIKARDLWNRIIQATYDVAEPGVIFIDRINQQNNLNYCETISATNPCGEQPLPPYGACLLGSVNLFSLVKDPFTDNARIENTDLERVVSIAIRMMDNVIDVSNFPLKAQETEAKNKRRIGLGITGLADALAACGLHYNTEEARLTAASWQKRINDCAYLTSANLAAEKGAFPLYDERYLEAPNIKKLPNIVREKIKQHGIRNALLTSIAPTGTISLFAGNISSGIEPMFAIEYQRKMLQPDGSLQTQDVIDAAVLKWRELYGDKPLPSTFITADKLTPHEHLLMQAALQPYVDSSISKTINCPVDISFEDFKNVYTEAYDLGCKGCTTYRPNPTTGSVLSVKETEAPVVDKLDSRPESLPGETYKIKFGDSEHAHYITITDVVDENGQRRPYEIFINSKNMEHYAWVVALTRMISAVFRKGGDVTFVVEELKAVFDPRGGHWHKGKYVPSLVAAIGGIIEKHMREIGFLEPLTKNGNAATSIMGSHCPKCNEFSVVKQEGCEKCMSCDYSKCG